MIGGLPGYSNLSLLGFEPERLRSNLKLLFSFLLSLVFLYPVAAIPAATLEISQGRAKSVNSQQKNQKKYNYFQVIDAKKENSK